MSNLMPCKDCNQPVSKSAKTCPHCGVKLRSGFFGKLFKGILYFFLFIFASLLAIGFLGSTTDTNVEKASAVKINAKSADAVSDDEVLKIMFDGMNEHLDAFNVNEYLDDAPQILEAATFFAEAGEIWGDATTSGKFSTSELEQYRTKLVKNQVANLPKLRDAYGPAMRQRLWEGDVSVRTIGPGYRTIAFVGGIFAANRNIKKIQDEAYTQLNILRFSKSTYKWYAESDEITYYELKFLSDTDIAKKNIIGNLEKIEVD